MKDIIYVFFFLCHHQVTVMGVRPVFEQVIKKTNKGSLPIVIGSIRGANPLLGILCKMIAQYGENERYLDWMADVFDLIGRLQ